MRDDPKPFFRFNPNAYDHGAFKASDKICEVCGRPSVWLYTGVIYGLHKPDPLTCARCINEGKLDDKLGEGEWGLHESYHDAEIRKEFAEELERTPAVSSHNPFEWPVHDGMPCAFLHYHTKSANSDFETPEAREAIRAEFDKLGWAAPYPLQYVLLFKELNGDRYHVWIDLD